MKGKEYPKNQDYKTLGPRFVLSIKVMIPEDPGRLVDILSRTGGL